MKLYIKQKVFSLTSKFTVKDEAGNDRYFVEGEFFSLRGRLHIMDAQGGEIGRIYRRLMTFLPHFILEIGGEEIAEIVKDFSFFRPKYSLENTSLSVEGEIEGLDWTIEGDFWAHEYSLYDGDRNIMNIHKEWFTWGDSYELDILDPDYELISLGIVLAIDTAMAAANTASSAST